MRGPRRRERSPRGAEVTATVEIPKDAAHGDYASSFAMAGAKAMHMAPRAIAQAIVDHLELEGTFFHKVEIAGPGFLNFTLGPKWYGQVLSDGGGRGERLRLQRRGPRARRSWWSSSPPTPPAPCTWATPGAACWGTPWPTCSSVDRV